MTVIALKHHLKTSDTLFGYKHLVYENGLD